MELPFLWFENALDLPVAAFEEMGVYSIVAATPLKHANSGTTDVQISVLAWATDVVLSSPTTANVGGISPQSDEYSNKTFSSKATLVASMMDRLSSAPMIGPYARATSLAASAASAISALFGFSKPVELERVLYVPKTVNDMATSGGKDDSHKLALDPKQELTIDPRAFGLGSKDEMEISYIASRESYLTTFVWTSGNSTPAGTILWNCIVDPAQHVVYTASGDDIPKITMTASCFAALPFQYWRGSMKYRFQVVCSAMHKGRLRIVYDPEIEVSYNDPSRISPEYNLGYQSIVDISETKDFEITVGWGQPTSYRENAFYAGSGDTNAITPLLYDASTTSYGNGVLGVYVMNELNNPSASVDDIYIVVSVSAGPDFEVAAPTNRPLSRLRFRTISIVNAPEEEAQGEAEPQSSEQPVSAVPSGVADTAESPRQSDLLADKSSLTSPTNLVYFGESIRSFRTLLRRFAMVEIAVLPNKIATGSTNGLSLQRKIFPIEPGFTSKSDLTGNRVTRTVKGKEYAYGYMTPLRFVSAGFAGWRGSIRWKVSNSLLCCATYSAPITVTRYSGCSPANISEVVPDKATNAGMAAYYTGFDEITTMQEGAQLVSPTVEPITSFEVPFYTQLRFLPARYLTTFSATRPDPFTSKTPCWKIGYELGIAAPTDIIQHQLYCASGEDFTLGMFIGAPIVYLESIPPS